jgi:hypothetical protein
MMRASRASREESEEALFPVMNTLGQVKTEVFKGVRDRDADWIKSVKSGLDPDDFRYGCSDIDPDRVVVGAVVKVGIIDEGTEWIWVKVIHVGPEVNNPDDGILVTAVLTHPVSSVVHSTLIFPRTKIP